jgi:hypothetical protein
MSAMKRHLSPRLVSVARRDVVIYDPNRQPTLHAHQIEQRRALAEETNAVFRQAVEGRPAQRQATQPNRLIRAIFAAATTFLQEIAR